MAHAQSPKEIVLEFYKLALEKLDPKTAFETYATPDFVEHSARSRSMKSRRLEFRERVQKFSVFIPTAG